MNYHTIYKAPFGSILIIKEDDLLTHIYLDADKGMKSLNTESIEDREKCLDVVKQLDLYFEGSLKNFDLKLKLNGTFFQRKAWDALMKIPYGEKISYKEQAKLMGSPESTRAVGNANGKNPIPIVIPCHRVIKNDGSIGGFSSGTDKKRILLELEEGSIF